MTAALPAVRVTDPTAFGRVAVLMGGDSRERDVSLVSGAGVLDALRSRGIDAQPVDGVAALVAALNAHRFERVFNILHGGAGENGVVQGVLQALGIPCTGTGILGAALTFDKIRTKQVWQAVGLPTPDFVRIEPLSLRERGWGEGAGTRAMLDGASAEHPHPPFGHLLPEGEGNSGSIHAAIDRLGYPLFIKPSCEGSSVGIARVRSEADLAAAQAVIDEYGGEMMAEPLIEGDELTVGILGGLALPSIHIVPRSGLYDYHAKYVAEDTRYLCPGLDAAGERVLGELALAAFAAAGCSGWGRVDLMRERASGKFWLLEINTTPGMTSHSLVPKAAAEVGIDYPELCWRVLETTLSAEGAA